MKVLLARNAGFCMGVRRAVDATLAILDEGSGPLATFGPLIHNPQVLQLLADRGVAALDRVPESFDGTVIIRAHGVPPEQKAALASAGARVRDATCPRVVKVQVIIDKHRKKGYRTVIIGDRDHAEVLGLMGYAGPDVRVVSRPEEIDALDLDGPYIIVSQTTQNEDAFEAMSRAILDRFPGGKVFNTICDSTHKRQEEVRQLARRVDAMVVVGGKASANTARLGEIAREMGCPVYMVESEEDLDLDLLSQYAVIGVTAGASTPTWMINLVVQVLESLPSAGEGRFKPALMRFFWFLLASNIAVSLAAGLLTVAASRLLGVACDPRYPLLAAGYVLAMHNLNRFQQIRAKQISDPVKAYFVQRHRRVLLGLSCAALAGAVLLAGSLGLVPLLTVLAISGLGVTYGMEKALRLPVVGRIRGLPGSKTAAIALAWAVVAVLLPVLGNHERLLPSHVAWTLALVFVLVYVRCALFDLLDIHGDRLVGRETLPVLLGEARTLDWVHKVLAGVLLLFVFLPFAGWLPPLAWWLAPAVVMMDLLARLYEHRRLPPGPRFELLLEGVFALMALLAWIGS